MFENISEAPADPILGLTEAFKNEQRDDKVNLGVGVYKDEEGNTPILESVKVAEERILSEEKTKSYLPISGKPEYGKNVRKLVFGSNHEILQSNRAATVQTPGGTGALRIAGDFIRKFFPEKSIWLSDPTWANHWKVFNAAEVEYKKYPYFDRSINWVNFDKTYDAISQIPDGDAILFHACCHNPTGVDFSNEEWEKLADLVKDKNLLVLFDFAYQGFGDGLEKDAEGIRIFAEKIDEFLVASSYSKNFGLYNERIGALTAVTKDAEIAERVFSQLKICVRSNFSNPPTHGSSIINTIFDDSELYQKWANEVTAMRERIHYLRNKLVEKLSEKGVKRDFSFINKQRGMFSFTGLTKDQVLKLRNEHAIYFVNSGRINLAGLNDNNIDKVAEAFVKVINEEE